MHLYGHSLGSLLAFDIVCNQPDRLEEGDIESESQSSDLSTSIGAQRVYEPGVDLGDLGSQHQHQQSTLTVMPPFLYGIKAGFSRACRLSINGSIR